MANGLHHLRAVKALVADSLHRQEVHGFGRGARPHRRGVGRDGSADRAAGDQQGDESYQGETSTQRPHGERTLLSIENREQGRNFRMRQLATVESRALYSGGGSSAQT